MKLSIHKTINTNSLWFHKQHLSNGWNIWVGFFNTIFYVKL